MPFALPPLLRTPDAFVKNKSLPRRVFQLRAGLRFVSNSASPVMGVRPSGCRALKKKENIDKSISVFRYFLKKIHKKKNKKIKIKNRKSFY